MSTATEPFLIRQWKSVGPSSPWGSIKGLSQLAGDAVAGCTVDGVDSFMLVKEALEAIEAGKRVNIKGWEYVAQGCDDAVHFDVQSECFLANNKSQLARKLSEVMRWVFVATPGTGSATHIDPLGTAACTWLTVGRKEWRMASGAPAGVESLPSLFDCSSDLSSYRHLYYFTMEPGDLIFIPQGCLHEVRNSTTTIEVTHNFVLQPAAMWGEVRRALSLVMAYGALSPLENHPKVDSLLFGMLMACLYGEVDMPEEVAVEAEKARQCIDFTEDDDDVDNNNS